MFPWEREPKSSALKKSKIRIYKKAIIGKRKAVYQPQYRSLLLANNKTKSATRLKYDSLVQDDYEENYQKSLALIKELKKIEKGGSQQTAEDKKIYTQKMLELDRQKQGIYNKRQKQKGLEISAIEKAFIAQLDQIKKKIQDQILATKPAYVQEALKSK